MNHAVRRFGFNRCLLSLGFILWGCLFLPPLQASPLPFELMENHAGESLSISVQDRKTGREILDASVVVLSASESDLPLAGEHPDARVIHVSKAGYESVSIAGVLGGQVTVSLQPVPTEKYIVVHGTVGGFTHTSPIYGAFVLPVFSLNAVPDMTLDSMISPMIDVIKLMGTHKVPSNIVFPKQNVFLGLKINKPRYRLRAIGKEPLELVTIQGQIPRSALIGDSLASRLDSPSDCDADESAMIAPGCERDGSAIGMDQLNALTINRMGLSSTFVPTEGLDVLIQGTTALLPFHNVRSHPAPFPADILAVALTDLDGDGKRLIPTDLKSPGMIEEPGRAKPVLLSVPARTRVTQKNTVGLFAMDDTRMTGILLRDVGQRVESPTYLDAPAYPEYEEIPAHVTVKQAANGIAVIRFFNALPPEDLLVREVSPWSVYLLPSAGEVTVPTERLRGQTIGRYAVSHWEFDETFAERQISSATLFEKLRRFVRSDGLLSSEALH